MLTRHSKIIVGQGREEIHPLVNSSILRHIFEYLDVKSLKSVRETCSFWNEDASIFLREKVRVTISWYDRTSSRLTSWSASTHPPTLPTFMKYVESVTPKNVLFRNYVLMNWIFHSNELEMTQFFLLCGEHIRSLSLWGPFHGFYEESTVRDVFYNWTPNLESIHIGRDIRFRDHPNYKPSKLCEKSKNQEDCDENDSEEEELRPGDYEDDSKSVFIPMSKFEIKEDIQPNYNFQNFCIQQGSVTTVFPIPWKELFLAYPNLKTLTVYSQLFHGSARDHGPSPNISDKDNIPGLLSALVEFQEENPDKLQNLKWLDIFKKAYYEGRHIEHALKLNFKLETLYIQEAHQLDYSSLTQYITKLSSSLKTLEIKSHDYPPALELFPPPGKIISFPNLKTLSVNFNALSSDNLEFLQNTPKLETLRIRNLSSRFELGRDLRLMFNTIKLQTLTTLRHLELTDEILTEDCVRKIGEWFPNLSHFMAVLDDNLLWAVYKYLNNSVKTLEVFGNANGITDAGITGTNTNSIEQVIIGPSIGQMKKLRRLTIDTDVFPPMVRLTDNAVHNGFLLLTELTYLKIFVGEDSITEQAYRELCDRRNILTLDTPRFYRGHEIKTRGWYQERMFVKTVV